MARPHPPRSTSRSPARRLTRWARAAVRRGRPSRSRSAPTPSAAPAAGRPAYRGDFEGRATIAYAPHPDGVADPGEVVWAWVPYEDDPRQGKDRPVLVIALAGEDLLGLMLTSQDHDDRPADGRTYHDLGTGAWDSRGRPSEVRLDRVLRLAPDAVRREGAALDRARFDAVTAAARRTLGW